MDNLRFLPTNETELLQLTPSQLRELPASTAKYFQSLGREPKSNEEREWIEHVVSFRLKSMKAESGRAISKNEITTDMRAFRRPSFQTQLPLSPPQCTDAHQNEGGLPANESELRQLTRSQLRALPASAKTYFKNLGRDPKSNEEKEWIERIASVRAKAIKHGGPRERASKENTTDTRAFECPSLETQVPIMPQQHAYESVDTAMLHSTYGNVQNNDIASYPGGNGHQPTTSTPLVDQPYQPREAETQFGSSDRRNGKMQAFATEPFNPVSKSRTGHDMPLWPSQLPKSLPVANSTFPERIMPILPSQLPRPSIQHRDLPTRGSTSTFQAPGEVQAMGALQSSTRHPHSAYGPEMVSMSDEHEQEPMQLQVSTQEEREHILSLLDVDEVLSDNYSDIVEEFLEIPEDVEMGEDGSRQDSASS